MRSQKGRCDFIWHRRIAARLLTPLLILLSPMRGYAACSELQPIDGSLGYRMRAGQRCEGMYRSLVAGEIELMAYMSKPLIFNPATDTSVILSASLGTAETTVPVIVVARALPIHTYYRMEATLLDNKALNWPLTEVVFPAGLRDVDLGVLAYKVTPSGKVYVPIAAFLSPNQIGISGPLTLTFRAPFALDKFQWRIEREVPQAWNRVLADKGARSGEPLSFVVDGPAHTTSTLLVAAKPVSADWMRFQIRIYFP